MNSAILSAFYRPGQKRFCALLSHEIKATTGHSVFSPDFTELVASRMILGSADHKCNSAMVYRLSPAGERYVLDMIEAGTLPKPERRMTAVPQ